MIEFLEQINSEVISIFHHLDLFMKVNEIISKNTRLASMDLTLMVWMRRAFTVDLVMGIGRICDTDKRTKSLVRFLQELKSESCQECLSRDAYIKLYRSENAFMLGLANGDFDRLAGPGEQSYATEKIDIDLKHLVEENPCKRIRDFRDQYVAHSDLIKNNQPPTYDDLFASFGVIKEIVKKYNLLLRAANMIDLTPTIQGNWEEVLTVPWIHKGQ